MANTVSKKQLRKLRPFLVGEQPGPDGEWDMYCPLHDDANRSAQLNIEKGVWYCHAGCGGGTVAALIDAEDTWVSPEGRVNGRVTRPSKAGSAQHETVTEGHVAGWHAALMDNPTALEEIMLARGVNVATLTKYEIGWDPDRKVYTIPVRGPKRRLWNVRRYDIAPRDERRKIYSVKGMGSPRLYPYGLLRTDPEWVIICEGEWDALLTLQHDIPAITRTGAAKVWKSDWSHHFEDKVVYLCHDCDKAGDDANRIVAKALMDVAKEVRVIRLPYEWKPKHGKDLTDFWLDNEEMASSELMALIEDAQLWNPNRDDPETLDPAEASVLDSFDASRVGDPLRLAVTIKGKRDPGYSLPRNVQYKCTQDAGSKCNICPLKNEDGHSKLEIDSGDPILLELIDSTNLQVGDVLRRHKGIPKCQRLQVEVDNYQSVEILYARPSIDHAKSDDAGDYKNMKVTSVGRHDTLPNNTVQVVGALYPDPRKQTNEFLCWDVRRMETSLDTFVLDGAAIQKMKRFQASEGERPIRKLGVIARALAAHVTKIYGRPEMHAAIDLAFHSALTFDFAGARVDRGWIELLIIGDTRTGKSEAAAQMIRHYNSGEMVSCESATFAGIIGGLQQYGQGKEWAVTWGAVPINDRRLVVLDEVGGLHPEEIARMSSVRSSGTAELTKIQSERTFARTRLIWLGNPRAGRMSEYTYGVQAIRPLIGNDEDIARFDLAMCVVADDVPASEINRHHRAGKMIYGTDSCSSLVRWAWSRKPENIVWVDDAEEVVMQAANEMGRLYIEDPPLVQVANVRIKIARLAVALAARLFSTDDEYENVLVRSEHVRDAVEFMSRLYRMRSFGYAERSNEIIHDRRAAQDHRNRIERYLEENPSLSKFLRSAGQFRRNDLEEIMNLSREESNAIINTLWESRMIRKDGANVKVEPTLHSILREVQ